MKIKNNWEWWIISKSLDWSRNSMLFYIHHTRSFLNPCHQPSLAVTKGDFRRKCILHTNDFWNNNIFMILPYHTNDFWNDNNIFMIRLFHYFNSLHDSSLPQQCPFLHPSLSLTVLAKERGVAVENHLQQPRMTVKEVYWRTNNEHDFIKL